MLLLYQFVGGISLPEVFGSFLTALMPAAMFDYLHQLIGGDAKHYLFYIILVGQCLVFALCGGLYNLYLAVAKPVASVKGSSSDERSQAETAVPSAGRRLQYQQGLMLAFVLWLLVGVVLLPLTGAGVFGIDLAVGFGNTIVSLAAVGVVYGLLFVLAQNWLVTRNRWYETLALLLICFTMFRPSYWLDRLQAPFDARPATDIMRVADTIPRGSTLRFRVMSQSRAGEDVEKIVRLTMPSGNTTAERLQRAGLTLSTLGDQVTISLVSFGSEAAKYGLAPGDQITSVLVPTDRASRYWFAIPALLLLGVVVLLQRRRQQLKLVVAR